MSICSSNKCLAGWCTTIHIYLGFAELEWPMATHIHTFQEVAELHTKRYLSKQQLILRRNKWPPLCSRTSTATIIIIIIVIILVEIHIINNPVMPPLGRLLSPQNVQTRVLRAPHTNGRNGTHIVVIVSPNAVRIATLLRGTALHEQLHCDIATLYTSSDDCELHKKVWKIWP